MEIILSEPDLIRAIINRDRVGAETLYDHYVAILFKIIYCSVKDEQKAEVILEKTIVKIWNNIELYELQNERLLIWMAGIARGLAKEARQPSHFVEEIINDYSSEIIQLPDSPQISLR